jgi:RNA polymerase sigma-70 factor (ECF subfamily)
VRDGTVQAGNDCDAVVPLAKPDRKRQCNLLGCSGHSSADTDEPNLEPVTRDDETDDALLARLARSGDARAFGTLYQRHTEVLYATAVRITGDVDGAGDLVHDAWIRAVENAQRFEQRSAVRTWITGILLNLIRERARDTRRNGDRYNLDDRRSNDGTDAAYAGPEPPVSSAADVAGVDPIDLDAAIAALPAGFRQILVLHDVEGFTHEEIAAMLGLVPGTSKSQLARARRRVREMLVEGVPRRV